MERRDTSGKSKKYEVETKVLAVDADAVARNLSLLGAEQVLDTRLIVNWYQALRAEPMPSFTTARTAVDGGILIAKGLNIEVSNLPDAIQLLREITTTQPVTVDTPSWYLRIRSSLVGQPEVTWKGLAEYEGNIRRSKEINFTVTYAERMAALFEQLGLEHYAYQEKDRRSWNHAAWKFDLDQYPGMPPYLEIEGRDSEHIREAISLLNLDGHQSTAEGETSLIRQKYGLDWNNMRFSQLRTL